MRHFLFLPLFFSCFALAQDEPRVLRALPLDFEEHPAAVLVKPAQPPAAELPPEPANIMPPAEAPREQAAVIPAPALFSEQAPSPAAALVSPLDEKPVGDDGFRLQIFLDQANFGPGVVDGKPGQFTTLAAQAWNEVHGHEIQSWSAVNIAARQAISNPFAVATIPEDAKAWVNSSLPTKRSGQAKLKRMSYRSIVEFMSERYHTDIPTLTALNPTKRIYGLKPGDSLIVPNVQPFLVENLTDRSYKEMEDLSERYVVVDTKINQVRIFAAAPRPAIITDPNGPGVPIANSALIASFPITPGKPKFVEFGSWKLQNMVELPWWRYDQQLLDTGKRSDNALMIPPGPNSPVGIIWNGTTKSGIGLHGTSDPETIGRSRSAGCIRLCNWDAIRLPTLIRPGATIEIR